MIWDYEGEQLLQPQHKISEKEERNGRNVVVAVICQLVGNTETRDP